MAPGEREGVGDPESRPASPGLADRYRVLVEHSPDAIAVHRRGTLVYLNPAGMRYLRAERADDVIGRPIAEFIAAESVGPMFERIAALDSHGTASAASEATVLALDGTRLIMEAVSVRTLWNGEPAFQVILRDLTEHKAAQKALQYQAALVEHVSDAIVGVSSDGLVSSWNPAAESVYGRCRPTFSVAASRTRSAFRVIRSRFFGPVDSCASRIVMRTAPRSPWWCPRPRCPTAGCWCAPTEAR